MIRYTKIEIVDAGTSETDVLCVKGSFRITNQADYDILPTQDRIGVVMGEDGNTFETYAATDSDVASDDLSIIGELTSDKQWHKLGDA